MSRLVVLPYVNGSASVRNLRVALNENMPNGLHPFISELRTENSRARLNEDDFVLNWGNRNSNHPAFRSGAHVINLPETVGIASNKRVCFEENQRAELPARTPRFTTDMDEALGWDRWPIVVRETLTGHSGEGIVLLENEDDYENYNHDNARLYVEYIPKKWEYRVHIFNGSVIDIRRKSRRPEHPNPNWRIRNHNNGFIYAQDRDHVVPNDVRLQARQIIFNLGIDFGAVDIIWNDSRQQAYMLEVNTAPGLEGSSVTNYANAIKNYITDVRG